MSFYPRFALALLSFFLFPGLANSQDTAPAAAPPKLFFHLEEDAVRLYWWVENRDDFARWQDAGYRIERRELSPNPSTDWTPLNGGTVQVAPLSKWKQSASTTVAKLLPMAYRPDGTRSKLTNPGLKERELFDFLKKRNNAIVYAGLYTLNDYEAAQLFGVAYVDRGIEPGAAYEYQLAPIAEPDARVNIAVRTGSPTYMPPVDDVRAEWRDREVELSWRNLGLGYFGFLVYRRAAGEETWNKVENGRLLDVDQLNNRTTFTDSLPDNETVYQYAIQGRGRLGIDGPITVNVQGKGRSLSEPPAPIVSLRDNKQGKFEVSWAFVDEQEAAVIDYFTVHRALSPTSAFSLVSGKLAGTDRVYLDDIVADQVWYRVIAHLSIGTEMPSTRYHVIADDTIAPPPVTGLKGEINREGHLNLTWDESPADDVIGYRVWFSNGRHRAGTRLTDTMEIRPEFNDTLDLTAVNDTVFYRVSALDERENIGDWCEPLALPIPDILPPAPPYLRSFRSDTNGVSFTYAPSSSEDVVRYEFQRKARFTDYWQTFATLPPVTVVSTYLDESGADDITYDYRLIALDEQDLRGVSNVLTAKRQPRMLFPAITDLTLSPRKEAVAIELTWVYPEDAAIRSFVVYRTDSGGRLRTYRTLAAEKVDRRLSRRQGEPAQWRFLDEEIRRDTEYAYAVRAVYRTGAESRDGQTISIKF